jgi:hypothetical protein
LFGTNIFAQNGHGILLTFTQAAGNVTSNNVYRSTTSGGPFTEIYTGTAAFTSYVDQTGVVGTEYWYAVTAVSGGQESALDSAMSPNGIVYPPQPPANLTAVKQ